MEHDRGPFGIPQSPPSICENIGDVVAGEDTTTHNVGDVLSIAGILEGNDENEF